MTTDDHEREEHPDRQRRKFLRKSIYAVYATPLITSLLVTKESAAASVCSYDWCRQAHFRPGCCRKYRY